MAFARSYINFVNYVIRLGDLIMMSNVLSFSASLIATLIGFLVLPAFSKPFPSCIEIAANIEIENSLPTNLLQSISMVESARKMADGTMRPWPWTLNHGGKSLFFDNKADASAYLRKNITRKYKNIDVGCMQINVKWHYDQFSSFDHMLDPEENMRYAALFLTKLKRRHGSWDEAIKYYHSSTSKLNTKYFAKVKHAWNENLNSSKLLHKVSIPTTDEIIFPRKNKLGDKLNLGFKDKKLADSNNSMIKYELKQSDSLNKVEPLNAIFVSNYRNEETSKSAEDVIHYSKIRSTYLRKNIDMILLFRNEFAKKE